MRWSQRLRQSRKWPRRARSRLRIRLRTRAGRSDLALNLAAEVDGERKGPALVVGLGNPGIEYQFTPHNAGFLAIDRIASDLKVEIRNRQCRALTVRATMGSEQVLLAKPETF